MRLLVVEDEHDLLDALARGLRNQGYAVDTASDLALARDKLRDTSYDIICLDLNLPGGDGRALCREIRQKRDGDMPRVLMLTARDTVADRVAGLDDGADDYLIKPFAFDELLARLRALLRRDHLGPGQVIEFGNLRVDVSRHEVLRAGRRVELTSKEFALLRYFVSHPGEVLSAERLLEHVWDENADPFSNTVRVTLSSLRRKIDDRGGRLIETVVGSGYRLRDE